MDKKRLQQLAGITEEFRYDPETHRKTYEAEQVYDRVASEVEQLIKQAAEESNLTKLQIYKNVMRRLHLFFSLGKE